METIGKNDYIKANRKGSREAEFEICTGFVCTHKVHKSRKDYDRRDNKINIREI